MKALSIKPPWIELIVSGRKWIETRTWPTNYRGKILLVSSKAVDRYAEDLFIGKYKPMPRGHALAIASLTECRRMNSYDERAALCEYIPGLFAWVLRDVRRIDPFPVKGQLGLYEVDYMDKEE